MTTKKPPKPTTAPTPFVEVVSISEIVPDDKNVNLDDERLLVLVEVKSRTADAAVFVGTAALVWLLVRVGSGASVPWTVDTAPPSASTDPANLPYYAARSLLRMFIALGVSIVFTFVYATAAARSRRAASR